MSVLFSKVEFNVSSYFYKLSLKVDACFSLRKLHTVHLTMFTLPSQILHVHPAFTDPPCSPCLHKSSMFTLPLQMPFHPSLFSYLLYLHNFLGGCLFLFCFVFAKLVYQLKCNFNTHYPLPKAQ